MLKTVVDTSPVGLTAVIVAALLAGSERAPRVMVIAFALWSIYALCLHFGARR